MRFYIGTPIIPYYHPIIRTLGFAVYRLDYGLSPYCLAPIVPYRHAMPRACALLGRVCFTFCLDYLIDIFVPLGRVFVAFWVRASAFEYHGRIGLDLRLGALQHVR